MYRNMDSQQYTLSNALLYLFAKLIGLDPLLVWSKAQKNNEGTFWFIFNNFAKARWGDIVATGKPATPHPATISDDLIRNRRLNAKLTN